MHDRQLTTNIRKLNTLCRLLDTVAVGTIMTALLVLVLTTMAGFPQHANADGDPTDMGFLLSRINEIDQRLNRLEAAAGIDAATPDSVKQNLPVLEVRSREDCIPCQIFRREVAGMQNLPIAVKYLTQSDWPVSSVPSFRYRTSAGIQRNRVGYREGDLRTMINEMTK